MSTVVLTVPPRFIGQLPGQLGIEFPCIERGASPLGDARLDQYDRVTFVVNGVEVYVDTIVVTVDDKWQPLLESFGFAPYVKPTVPPTP